MYVLSVSSVFRRMFQVLYLDVLKVDRVLHLPSRLLLPRLGVPSSPSAALHPSLTAEWAPRGLVERAHQGIAARTRAHALPFCYAGRNRLSLDSRCWAGIPLLLSAQAHLSSRLDASSPIN